MRRHRRKFLNFIRGNTTTVSSPYNALLNSFLGVLSPLNPPSEHESYSLVYKVLLGRFALSTYRVALEQGEPMDVYKRTLSEHPLLFHLDLSFGSCSLFRQEAKVFMAEALPAQLKLLNLDYGQIPFHSSGEFSAALNRLSTLIAFNLQLRACDSLSELDFLFQELERLSNLKCLTINCNGCKGISSVDSFLLLAQKLSRLEVLEFRLANCSCLSFSVTNCFLPTIATIFATNSTLQVLMLDISNLSMPMIDRVGLCYLSYCAAEIDILSVLRDCWRIWV
jgi:hypothetical protein